MSNSCNIHLLCTPYLMRIQSFNHPTNPSSSSCSLHPHVSVRIQRPRNTRCHGGTEMFKYLVQCPSLSPPELDGTVLSTPRCRIMLLSLVHHLVAMEYHCTPTPLLTSISSRTRPSEGNPCISAKNQMASVHEWKANTVPLEFLSCEASR